MSDGLVHPHPRRRDRPELVRPLGRQVRAPSPLTGTICPTYEQLLTGWERTTDRGSGSIRTYLDSVREVQR